MAVGREGRRVRVEERCRIGEGEAISIEIQKCKRVVRARRQKLSRASASLRTRTLIRPEDAFFEGGLKPLPSRVIVCLSRWDLPGYRSLPEDGSREINLTSTYHITYTYTYTYTFHSLYRPQSLDPSILRLLLVKVPSPQTIANLHWIHSQPSSSHQRTQRSITRGQFNSLSLTFSPDSLNSPDLALWLSYRALSKLAWVDHGSKN